MRRNILLGLGALAVGGWLLRDRVTLRENIHWRDIDKPGGVIEVNGYGVHYTDQGHGQPILLIHGFGGHTYSYRHLIPLFATDYRVIAVDLKGYGYSERDANQDLSRTAQVEMLRVFLGRLAVDHAIVVGHSMGGGIAQRFAATYPEKVDALVLAASVTGEERIARRAPVGLLRPALPLLAKLTASRLLHLGYYDPSMVTDDVRAEYLRPASIEGSMDGLLKAMRDGASDPPIADERITMPVLLLNGAHDRVVPLHAAQRICERIPHARLVVIEQAAHLLLEERPQECADAIRSFLQEEGVASGTTSRSA